MEVLITPEAGRQLEDLPGPIQVRIVRIMARLEQWPNVSGARPLRGDLAGRFRIRTGDYRVQFFPQQNRIVVEKVGHRDGFYEE